MVTVWGALAVGGNIMLLWLWVTLLSFQHRPTAVILKAIGGLGLMPNVIGAALLCWEVIPVLSGSGPGEEQTETSPCGYKSAH